MYWVLKALLYAGVLAEVIHKVGRLRHVRLYVAAVALAVFCARHMIVARTGKVVVERNNPVALLD